jgi:hypothetical protein
MQATIRVRDVVVDAVTRSPAVGALKTQLQSLRQLPPSARTSATAWITWMRSSRPSGGTI